MAMIKLHKNAAVLVTRDDDALAEAQATDAGRLCIGPRLSSTVAWIDHRRVETLREGLSRAGFTPRITTDDDSTRGDA